MATLSVSDYSPEAISKFKIGDKVKRILKKNGSGSGAIEIGSIGTVVKFIEKEKTVGKKNLTVTYIELEEFPGKLNLPQFFEHTNVIQTEDMVLQSVIKKVVLSIKERR